MYSILQTGFESNLVRNSMVWYNLSMAKEISAPKEPHSSLSTDIVSLVKAEQDQWIEIWQDPKFSESFPNLTPRLLALDEKDREKIYKFGLSALTKLDPRQKRDSITTNVFRINEDTTPPSWKKTRSVTITPDTELLLSITIGCFELLGNSLENKEFANKHLVEAYKKMNPDNKTTTKSQKFRFYMWLFLQNNSLFRKWIQLAQLDMQNGFVWDRAVAKRCLSLLSSYVKDIPNQEFPDIFPKELRRDISVYAPVAIDEFAAYATAYAETMSLTQTRRNHLREFIIETRNLIKDGFFQRTDLSPQVEPFQIEAKITELEQLLSKNKP